jgi:hypothetical protein
LVRPRWRRRRAHARARGDAVEEDVGPSQLGGRVIFTPPLFALYEEPRMDYAGTRESDCAARG